MMNSKSIPTSSKPASEKGTVKNRKGATETGRLFIDVNGMIRPPTVPLTRYVE